MIDSTVFYLAAIPAVLIVGISKGGFGGGLGVVAVPLLTLVVSPVQAAAVMLPVLCVMDLASVWAFRKVRPGRQLPVLLGGATLGMLAGALMWRSIDVAWVKLLIGVEALAFTVHHVWRTRGGPLAPRPADPRRAVFWGSVSGFTSFLAHAGGPPLAAYLLPQRLPRAEFVGITVFFFTAVNYAKILPYAWLGQFDSTNLATSLILIPLALIGVRLGVVLHKRLPEGPFYVVCYVGLAVSGVKLLWDAVVDLAAR